MVQRAAAEPLGASVLSSGHRARETSANPGDASPWAPVPHYQLGWAGRMSVCRLNSRTPEPQDGSHAVQLCALVPIR